MRKLNLRGHQAPAGFSALSLAVAMALGSMSSGAMALGGGVSTVPTPAATAKAISDPRVVDLGVAASTDVKSFTVALAVRNQAALDAFVAAVADPKNANFRKFITPAQFAAAYGQTPAAVAQVVAYLTSQGFTITKVHANNLAISATGTNAQIAAAFGSPIHAYNLAGVAYQAPAKKAVMPAALAGIAKTVAGLNTLPNFRGHRVAIPNTGALAGDVAVVTGAAAVPASGPGSYTVLDLAAKYNINPLYAKGLSGAGRTIGIATLAGYDQSDVYAYWNQLNLPVSQNRIVDVPVDGGADSKSGPGTEGAGETTLDVEQSGGVAPGANIRVYIAPNTDAGFIDMFAQAINENLIDVLSVSWGSPEIVYDQDTLDAFHALFEQAGAQGIPVIAAAGDAGAFDITRSYTYPQCTTLVTVDFPAADPDVLGAGGTTLPNSVQHLHGVVTETAERAWGWDYLKDYIVQYYGTDLYYSEYMVVGGGGAVSVDFALPQFQTGLNGVQTSATAQSLFCSPAFIGAKGTGYVDIADLPGGLAGRNLPDVSLNADPYSGYAIYEAGWGTGSGGTSFVAPQLNGILTLISSGLPAGQRIGPINPQLYAAFKAKGYSAGSPFKAITSGANGYYKSTSTYNPATGLGSLDVNALATILGVN